MRLALIALVAAVVVGVLVAATHASPRPSGAGAQVVIGADIYALGSRSGSCQTIGGDFSVSIPSDGDGVYFHLLRTRKDHGDYRGVVWHDSRRHEGVVLGATITVGKDADGRTSGIFSGLSTKGVRTTGSFVCE